MLENKYQDEKQENTCTIMGIVTTNARNLLFVQQFN
jgi:hypothetical protein